MAKNTNKKPNKEDDFALTPVTEEPKVKKWKAGKYRYLKNYFGTLGVFEQGKEYDMTEELANIFGNAGEIEKC